MIRSVTSVIAAVASTHNSKRRPTRPAATPQATRPGISYPQHEGCW